jgi:NADPH:quinone reductase-like Zn-dependent oxidoreductase
MKMKAVVFHEHGGPEKLSFEEMPLPEVGPFDVLVKVNASTLNHLDLWHRKGLPGVKTPMPHISGCEGAGVVARVGPEVAHIKEGDAVVVTPGWSCNRCEYCVSGHESVCLQYGMMGVKRNGCFAEYVAASADTIYPKPSNLSFEEAASMPLVFLTAWHMLVARAGLRQGEDVLVQAAGSGVGIAAIQIAKLFGARVFATASTDEKLQKAKELGADILINYTQKDFAEEIRTITGKRGVDVIVDHTGEANWQKNIVSLGRNGRLVICGNTSGFDAHTDLRHVFSRQLSILGSNMGSRKDLMDVFRMIRQGRLRPVIDSVFPLDQVRAAEERLADRNAFGKIVIRIG